MWLDNVLLAAFAALPALQGVALRRFYRAHAAAPVAGSVSPGALIAGNFLLLSLLLSLPLRDVHLRPGVEREPSQGFLAVLKQRDLMPLWWIGAIFAIALASVFTFLKRYIDETGYGTVGGFLTV